MIFDRNYDLSLLCIMKSDKKNTENIQSFVRSIPAELMSNIRTAIAQFKNKTFVFTGQNDDFFTKKSETEPRVYFYFDLYEDGSLKICKEYYNGQWEDDLFELRLHPINLDDAKKMGRSSEKMLGSAMVARESDEIFPDVPCLEYIKTEYDLVKAPIGHYVRFERTKEKERKRPISMRKISQELNGERLLK